MLQELDSVVTRARMFQFKPDGDVTYTKAQDAVGIPAPVMQDPIHYPHGTKFMAPGARPSPSPYPHAAACPTSGLTACCNTKWLPPPLSVLHTCTVRPLTHVTCCALTKSCNCYRALEQLTSARKLAALQMGRWKLPMII